MLMVGKRVSLDAKTILLGIISDTTLNTKTRNIINHVILIAKMTISKVKYGKYLNPVILFHSECRKRNIYLETSA